MTWSRTCIISFSLVATALLVVGFLQHQRATAFQADNQSLHQQLLTLQTDNTRLSNQLAEAKSAPAPQSDSSAELARLRREAASLRRQTNKLQSSLVKIGTSRAAAPEPDPDWTVLPENYPQTAQAAARTVLDLLNQGNSQQFFLYFGQPGGRQMYESIFANPHSKQLLGMQVIDIGEATTNPLASELLMVPYKVRLADGTERERKMNLFQDPDTHRWYFKGGL